MIFVITEEATLVTFGYSFQVTWCFKDGSYLVNSKQFYGASRVEAARPEWTATQLAAVEEKLDKAGCEASVTGALHPLEKPRFDGHAGESPTKNNK